MRIAHLASPSELAAVERLQLRVWGRDLRAVAGRNLLKAAITSGGMVAGAFVAGKLAGFAYGFWGLRGGRRVFWSHMLGVLPAFRHLGVGAALKRFQRRFVSARGGQAIEWTFDPLRAGNAHFNLHKLGAESAEYLVDTYGPMRDGLNWGLPTDRLVAHWPAHAKGRVRAPSAGRVAAWLDARGSGRFAVPAPRGRSVRGRWAKIAVPSDLAALKRASLPLARRWRLAAREAFRAAFSSGFRAVEFASGKRVGWYLLRR